MSFFGGLMGLRFPGLGGGAAQGQYPQFRQGVGGREPGQFGERMFSPHGQGRLWQMYQMANNPGHMAQEPGPPQMPGGYRPPEPHAPQMPPYASPEPQPPRVPMPNVGTPWTGGTPTYGSKPNVPPPMFGGFRPPPYKGPY